MKGKKEIINKDPVYIWFHRPQFHANVGLADQTYKKGFDHAQGCRPLQAIILLRSPRNCWIRGVAADLVARMRRDTDHEDDRISGEGFF